MVHVECHPVVRFHSFLLPLVALCSHSVPDHSSMLPPTFINSFTLNCPKYWCFYFLHRFLLLHMIIWTTILILPCCHLFVHVALHFLSLLLSCCLFYSAPSSSFHQRAAALFFSFTLIDPHICFLMFLHSTCVTKTSESCPYILPRFYNFIQVISATGVDAFDIFIFSFRCFCKFNFLQLCFYDCTHSICGLACF